MLAAFLVLAPPLYFLGPFVVLMLLGGVRTPKEWFALAIASGGILLAVSGSAQLGPALLRGSGIAVAIAFGVVSVRARGPALPRAALAVGLATAGLAIWCGWQGITWPEIERTFTAMLVETYRAVPSLTSDPATQRDLQGFIDPMVVAAPDIARVMPGLLAVQALGGTALAGVWHHRIASQPIGLAPAPFRAFRFNDHVIWGAILTLALVLLPLPANGHAAAMNALVVWTGLYAFRGLAVLAALLTRVSLALRVAAVIFAVLLNPIALGVCLSIGLADTWVDIRERLRPSPPEGVSP